MASVMIDWSGGECPVAPDTPIEFRHREASGQSFSFVPQELNWKHRPRRFGGDIVGYRVLSIEEADQMQRDCAAKRARLNQMLEHSHVAQVRQ